MEVNTYLFDFDGTLVDSMPTFVKAMLKVLDDYNIKYDDDIVKIITPLGYKGSAEYFQKLGLKLSTEEIIDIVNKYAINEYAYNIPAKSNVINTLKELKNKGIRKADKDGALVSLEHLKYAQVVNLYYDNIINN